MQIITLVDRHALLILTVLSPFGGDQTDKHKANLLVCFGLWISHKQPDRSEETTWYWRRLSRRCHNHCHKEWCWCWRAGGKQVTLLCDTYCMFLEHFLLYAKDDDTKTILCIQQSNGGVDSTFAATTKYCSSPHSSETFAIFFCILVAVTLFVQQTYLRRYNIPVSPVLSNHAPIHSRDRKQSLQQLAWRQILEY